MKRKDKGSKDDGEPEKHSDRSCRTKDKDFTVAARLLRYKAKTRNLLVSRFSISLDLLRKQVKNKKRKEKMRDGNHHRQQGLVLVTVALTVPRLNACTSSTYLFIFLFFWRVKVRKPAYTHFSVHTILSLLLTRVRNNWPTLITEFSSGLMIGRIASL